MSPMLFYSKVSIAATLVERPLSYDPTTLISGPCILGSRSKAIESKQCRKTLILHHFLFALRSFTRNESYELLNFLPRVVVRKLIFGFWC